MSIGEDRQMRVLTFPNKARFYQKRGGLSSGERDYGAWNTDDIGIDAPPLDAGAKTVDIGGHLEVVLLSSRRLNRYTVSVVQDTGDLYAWRGDHSRIAILGNFGPDCYERAEAALDGWVEEGRPLAGRPLSWFVERAAAGAGLG